MLLLKTRVGREEEVVEGTEQQIYQMGNVARDGSCTGYKGKRAVGTLVSMAWSLHFSFANVRTKFMADDYMTWRWREGFGISLSN